MSISALKFRDRLWWYDEYRMKVFSGMTYYKDSSDLYITNPAGISFGFEPNATGPNDPTSEFLIFKYGNGCKLRIEYRLYVTPYTGGETYYLNYCRANLYDKDDNKVQGASVSFGVSSKNYIATDPIAPYSQCMFVPGRVNYGTNRPTIVGEEAGSIWAGAFYIKNHKQLLPVPFTEEERLLLYQNTWEGFPFLTANNDAEYQQILSYWTNNGDGSDPHGEGEGGGEDDPTPSEPGGGDKPTYGPVDGDPVGFPGLPTVSAFTTGLISAYKMSVVQLNSLASELWSNNFFDSISKILNDPFDALIGLSLIPVAISGTDSVIKIGNYTSETHGQKLTAQFMTVQAGSFTVPLAWQNFLDFTQTQISIYLPFVGIKKIDPDDVMGKLVTVQYNIDVLTGAAVCFVKCANSVLYSYPCNIGYDIPLTGSNKAALYTGLINIATTAVTGAVVGGAGGAVMGAATGAVSTATSKQSEVDRSGGLSANTGLLAEFNCYVIIHRPTQSLPAQFKNIKGYKSNITKALNLCRGFTKVDTIHLSVPGANAAELTEIESLLKQGVLI